MEDEDEDETAVSTPATVPLDHTSSAVSLPSLSQITTMTSPPSVLLSTSGRHYSISSASQASYSPYFLSNQTSPAFGPRLSHAPNSGSREVFGLGSPALKPLDALQRSGQSVTKTRGPPSAQPSQMSQGRQSQSELDKEATAALLMLNNDRRDWRSARESDVGRDSSGMSVKDLLSG